MDDSEITELARGMVPFVRECVAETVTPLAARLAELEARPIQKGEPGEKGADGSPGPPGPKGDSGELAMIPPELAEQVASAVRLLHESPAIAKREEQPVPKSPPRVSRIERDDDGNLVPVYNDQPV